MSDQRFFVTGAMGCIGAWVVRELVREGIPITVYDLASDPHRLRLIMTDDELARVRFVTGDITNLDILKHALAESGATHVVHLAALQVPFCRANPSLGASVNVVGTVNMFEAVKAAGLRHLTYASSVAVYGPSEEYPEATVSDDAEPRPRTLYGVYKQANEGTARIYWQDERISSIGLRPFTVYGPGRDQGMTSFPTKAMLAAVLGQPYHIPFGGRGGFQYVEDVARIFIACARAPFEGAAAFNLRGSIVHMSELVAAIEAGEPGARGQITYEDKPLALPEGTEDTGLVGVLGSVPFTPLEQGVSATMSLFKTALANNRLAAEIK